MSGAADTGSVASLGDEREISVARISTGELEDIIKGSMPSLDNGVPVLIVRSSDGRLAAVDVNGLQILVPTTTTTNCKEGRDGEGKLKDWPTTTTTNCREGRDGEGKLKDFSAWLLLLASLTASITYTAGLTPPGGVWSADDKANGYVAGNPVLRDKSRGRYWVFYYGNTTAFVTSLLIIAMLSNPKRSALFVFFFRVAVGLCLLGLASSYTGATGVDKSSCVYTSAMLFGLLVYLVTSEVLLFLFRREARYLGERCG